MPQLRSNSQRPRTAPETQSSGSSPLDLGTIHQALPRPTSRPSSAPLNLGTIHQALPRSTSRPSSVGQQSRRNVGSQLSQHLDGKTGQSPNNKVQRTVNKPSTGERSKLVSMSNRSSNSGGSSSSPGFGGHGVFKTSKNKIGEGNQSPLVKGMKVSELDIPSFILNLPPELLSRCLTNLESVYHLVNCAHVCRSWREILLSDTVWKPMYLRMWDLLEGGDGLNGEMLSVDETPSTRKSLPEGYTSWRAAFSGNYQNAKKNLLVREKSQALDRGHLHSRPLRDRNGKQVFDCGQGEAMRKLATELGLSFQVKLNRGRTVRLQGKGKVEIFEGSCLLRYPTTGIGNLTLASLKSVEVTATSDKLLRICPAIELTYLQTSNWCMVSTASRSPGPLKLLQQRISSGVSVIVGTLAEEQTPEDGFNEQDLVMRDPLLLLVVNIHLNDLLWKVMKLGEGLSSRVNRRIARDELDHHYGLHSWQASIQIRTFGKNIWTRRYRQVFWSPRESTPGEKAVFELAQQHEVFPAVLKLPWKSEAFSGALSGVYMLDFTLWDEGGEIAWQYSGAVRIDPAPLAVVEYGLEFDGERVQTVVAEDERGVRLSINMCIPLSITYWNTKADRPIIALTSLQLTLTSKFLADWCGVANI